MIIRRLVLLLVPLGLAAVLPGSRAREDTPAQPEGVEVQARGPVHEAYAAPADSNPEPTPVVTKPPPEPVSEMPPEQKPEGDAVVWMPGYWDWDQDAQQYLWVSGIWRDQPPGRKWVPGFWQQVEGGWQRVRGFWAPEDQEQLNYLAPPPETLERGPTTEAPDANSFYTPGCWVFWQERYRWRPGFWKRYVPGWVWIPSDYTWTPSGYLFVEGYWDHPLDERGLLFAPVRFNRELLTRDFTYVPSYAVRGDALLSALFVRPGWRSYYFGDYFDERDSRRFIPWVNYHPARNVLDANFNYYRHEFAGAPAWERNLRGLYAARSGGEVPRPPRTLTQQTEVVRNLTERREHNTPVNQTVPLTRLQNAQVLEPIKAGNHLRVTSLGALAGPRAEGRSDVRRDIKLQEVSKEHRTAAQQAATQLHEVAKKRQQAEARLLTEGQPLRPHDPPRTLKLEVPRSRPVPATPGPRVQPGTPAPQPPKRFKELPPPAQLPKMHSGLPRDERPVPPPRQPPERRPEVRPPAPQGRPEERPTPQQHPPVSPRPQPTPVEPPRPQATPPSPHPQPPPPPRPKDKDERPMPPPKTPKPPQD